MGDDDVAGSGGANGRLAALQRDTTVGISKNQELPAGVGSSFGQRRLDVDERV